MCFDFLDHLLARARLHEKLDLARRTYAATITAYEATVKALTDGIETRIHVDAGCGEYDVLIAQDGFVQGGCEAAPAFALTLAAAIRKFLHEARSIAPEGSFRVWASADDLYLQCKPEHWEQLTLCLQAALSSVGLERRPDKPHSLLPTGVEMSDSFRQLAELHTDAIPVLGIFASAGAR